MVAVDKRKRAVVQRRGAAAHRNARSAARGVVCAPMTALWALLAVLPSPHATVLQSPLAVLPTPPPTVALAASVADPASSPARLA